MKDRCFWMAWLLTGLAMTPWAEGQVRNGRGGGVGGRVYGPVLPRETIVRPAGGLWVGGGAMAVGGMIGNGVFAAPVVVAPPILAPGVPAFSLYDPWGFGGLVWMGAPITYWQNPAVTQPIVVLPPAAAVSQPLADAWRENLERWGPDLPPAKPDPVALPVPPSSPEAKLRSLRAQQQGDEHLRNQEWLAAYLDYKRAVQAAPDNAEAHFRLGLALTTIQHFDNAIRSFKRALALDPMLPQRGPDLETLMGETSEIARTATLQKVVEHAAEDVRDPDRLFLLGLLLHFSRDERAGQVLETGYRLAGGGRHFLAFLQPKAANNPPPAQDPAQPDHKNLPVLPPAPLPSPP